MWQSVNSGGGAAWTPCALQGELCLQPGKGDHGKAHMAINHG